MYFVCLSEELSEAMGYDTMEDPDAFCSSTKFALEALFEEIANRSGFTVDEVKTKTSVFYGIPAK
jgi:hypothetical protein